MKVFLASQLIRALHFFFGRTYRIQVGSDGPLPEKGVFAFWHGSNFPIFEANPIKKMAIVIADGPKGEIFTNAVKDFDNRIIRVPFGNEPKKAALSVLEMMRTLEEGYSLGIAVDGPSGPRYSIKPGIFYIAGKSGEKIYPVGVAASHKLTAPFRWDRYFIPLPFSKVVLYVGKGVPADTNEKELRNCMFQAEKAANSLL